MTTATESASLAEYKSSVAPAMAKEKQFDWPLCYTAENFDLDQIRAFLSRNTFAARLSERMHTETGTLLIDWADYLVLSADAEPTLRNTGFTDDPLGEPPVNTHKTFWHPDAMLPRVILDYAVRRADNPLAVAIHVDDLSDFMAV